MSANFLDAFEGPLTLKVNGKDVDVHPLTTRDLLPWLSNLTEKQKDSDRRLVPKEMKPVDRFRVLRNIEAITKSPDSIAQEVFTADGTIRVLELALKKSGVPDDQAQKFIDSQPVKLNEYLAVRLCGCYTSRQVADIYFPQRVDVTDFVSSEDNNDSGGQAFTSPLEGGDPNAGSPAPSAGPSPTGPSTESSSNPTPIATPST